MSQVLMAGFVFSLIITIFLIFVRYLFIMVVPSPFFSPMGRSYENSKKV